MTTLSLSVKSKADVIIEFDAIWRVVIDHYEKITMIKIQSLVKVKNVNEILNDIHERETKFKAHRHDDSKLNKFRTLVSKSLNFIKKLSDMIALIASMIRKESLSAHWLRLTYVCITKVLFFQHCHFYDCSLSYQRIISIFLYSMILNKC